MAMTTTSATLRVFLPWLLLAAAPTQAAQFCVGTSDALRAALEEAEDNGEADQIRIRAGTYTVTTGSVTAFYYYAQENFALSIEGGYGFNCTRKSNRADATVLSGSGQRNVMSLCSSSAGALSVRNLTLRDGEGTAAGAGLNIGCSVGPFFTAFHGNVTVERVIAVLNRAGEAPGGIVARTREGTIAFRGNLIAFNQCGEDHCALEIASTAPDDETVMVYFGGNTVAANTCSLGAPASCESGGARFTGRQDALVYDNLFVLHQGNDVSLSSLSESTSQLYHNNIPMLDGVPDTEVGTHTGDDAMFEDALALDFRLRSGSPMIDLGNAPYPLPTIDLDGRPRTAGSAPDLGAYEFSALLFDDGFEDGP